MKYLKLYEEFTTDVKYSIEWQAPDDKLINQEMHEAHKRFLEHLFLAKS